MIDIVEGTREFALTPSSKAWTMTSRKTLFFRPYSWLLRRSKTSEGRKPPRKGMRRAKKEGRWVGMAPKGYKNARDSANRPIVVPNEDAHFVKLAFKKMAEGVYYMEEIRKELERAGLRLQ